MKSIIIYIKKIDEDSSDYIGYHVGLGEQDEVLYE